MCRLEIMYSSLLLDLTTMCGTVLNSGCGKTSDMHKYLPKETGLTWSAKQARKLDPNITNEYLLYKPRDWWNFLAPKSRILALILAPRFHRFRAPFAQHWHCIAIHLQVIASISKLWQVLESMTIFNQHDFQYMWSTAASNLCYKPDITQFLLIIN